MAMMPWYTGYIGGVYYQTQTPWYDNAQLQQFFDAEVVPKKKETIRIISVLKPDLDKLFELIAQYDSRLYQKVAHVGSYYQGLKVRRADEFDYTLCIDIDAKQVVSYGSDGCVFYGFKGYDSEMERLAHTIPQVQCVLRLLLIS